MNVSTIKTNKIKTGTASLISVLDKYVQTIEEGEILVITSKIVSLCEGRATPIGSIKKEDLVEKEADLFLDSGPGKCGIRFTITSNTLIPTAGIDESNTDGHYVLWPKNAQKTANDIRSYLCKRFGVKKVGVIITDSTCMPMRWGTSGISLAHSGFKASNNYVGTKDLFGHKFKVSHSNIAGGLAASAVVVMGEGTEQTPLCLISDVPFVQFQDRNPNKSELNEINISPDDDLFAPFFESVTWKEGPKQKL